MTRSLPVPPTWLVLTSLLAVSAPAMAAGTPSGTSIENQVIATFDPLLPGGPTQALSNKVVTTVQAVCAVSVTPAGQSSAHLIGGEQTSFGFIVTNAGNQNFNLPLAVSSGGVTPPPELSLYLDANGNGVVDAGEQPINAVNIPADGTAHVAVLMKTTSAAQGSGTVNLVASCGAGGDQAQAVTQVMVSPPPTLGVTKSFTPALVRPGTETTVSVSTVNGGTYASRAVMLTDPLTEQVAQGLVFVPGSASTNVGVIEYTSNGNTWSATEPASVTGIRVRVDTLAAGASVNLTFRMKALESADGKKILNVATASTSGTEVQGSATADVHYLPGVAIGPVGNPLAPEGSDADTQTRAFAVVGQQICFDHTVLNTGDVKDNFRITVTFPQGQTDVVLLGVNGQPLVQPITLDPNGTALVRVCYTPTAATPLNARITVNGDRGTTNTTADLISEVASTMPELKKSYVATTVDEQGQVKTLPDGASTVIGDTVTYTLQVRNPYARALTNVVITDPLSTHVNFVSASDGGQVSGAPGQEVVSWALGTLAPGETRRLTIVTKVSDRAVDGEELNNIFNMVSSELPEGQKSNEVKTPVWNAALIITKAVSAPVVAYGDEVTYTLTIRNASATTAIESAVITDTPTVGLEYLPGTSLLGGQALVDPTIQGGVMTWNAGTIPANGEIKVQYDMRITPAAGSDLLNVAIVSGVGVGRAAKAIASNKAMAVTKLDPLKFAPLSDIMGVVFVDRNRNGLYDKGFDTPVERARVILAGGRLALTDSAGRYHFANVPNGTWALRLDPTTTPYSPLNAVQDGGLSGTRTVHMRGLTSVDFPLAPVAGDIETLRRTTLSIGDVSVEKVVYAVPGGYIVNLRINSVKALSDFNLSDPLPGGATLKEGRNTLVTNLNAGETNLTYHFDWTGDPSAATTDPVVSWRY